MIPLKWIYGVLVNEPLYVPLHRLPYVTTTEVQDILLTPRGDDGEPVDDSNLSSEQIYKLMFAKHGATPQQQNRLWRNFSSGGCNAPRHQWKAFVDKVMGWDREPWRRPKGLE